MAWHRSTPIKPHVAPVSTIDLESIREDYPMLAARLLHLSYPHLAAIHARVIVESKANLSLWACPATDQALALVQAALDREAA